MAKKRKRPRQRPPSAPQAPARGGAARGGAARGGAARGGAARGGAARGGANIERRERKEEARKLREAERRRARRAASLRRTVTSIGIAAAAVAAITIFQSLSGPNDIPEGAVRAAEQAGCTGIDKRPDITPSDPQQRHLAAGETFGYPDRPATSGRHAPSSLPDDPKVYDTPIDETAAVHSMEHGAVFVYYLPEADGGIAQDVVDRLAEIAEGANATFLAPYADLTPETALTLTAWNYRQSCPGASTDDGRGLTPQSAAIIMNGFVTGFECTGEAPENGAPPC